MNPNELHTQQVEKLPSHSRWTKSRPMDVFIIVIFVAIVFSSHLLPSAVDILALIGLLAMLIAALQKK